MNTFSKFSRFCFVIATSLLMVLPVSAKDKFMSFKSLREIPLSVPDSLLRFTSEGKQCPIVDVISNIDFSVESDSVYVTTISDGSTKDGYKRIYFYNTPKKVKIIAPGFDWEYLFLSGDSIKQIEYGKQYETFLYESAGGEFIENHAKVTILVSPDGLEDLCIKIDGEAKTDWEQRVIERCRSGLHTYSVSAKGYKSVSGHFWVVSPKPVVININLVDKIYAQLPSTVDISPAFAADTTKVPEGVSPEKLPFTKEEKVWMGQDILKLIYKYISDCNYTPTPENSGSETASTEPQQVVTGRDSYVAPLTPKDVPFVVTPGLAKLVKVSRIQCIGLETAAQAKKRRYDSADRYYQFLITEIPSPDVRPYHTLSLYIVGMDYKLYCAGSYCISSNKTASPLLHAISEYVSFYGSAYDRSDFYRRKDGGVRYWYGDIGTAGYKLPNMIRGFFLAYDELDAKNSLNLVLNYFDDCSFTLF